MVVIDLSFFSKPYINQSKFDNNDNINALFFLWEINRI